VFQSLQPGEHKIILSTNIAETSVTIDDVAVVIDSGRLKEKVYDPHVKLAYLKASWISQASARQRKGRAGRTRSGVCFHLFSKRRHTSLPEFQDSEILRMPLEELVLQAKQLGLAPGHGDAHDSIQAFLQKALDPPHDLSIANAVSLLQAISCLDEQEQVTTIGKAVSLLPLDPRIGRIILLGCICGCGPAVLATSAAMGYRDPFVMPTNDQQRAAGNAAKARLTNGYPSDQIALLRALEGFACQRAYQFCDDNFLSVSVMNYLKDLIQQLTQTLRESGVNSTQAYAQRNNGNMPLLMSIVSIGLYPDIGVRQEGKLPFLLEKGRKAKIHPSSVNAKSPLYKAPCSKGMDLVGFQNLVSVPNVVPGGTGLLMLNTTPMSIFSLLLTCGIIKEVDDVSDADTESSLGEDLVTIEVDGWIKLKTSPLILALMKQCRMTIANAMDEFLSSPDMLLPPHLSKGANAVAQALALEQPISRVATGDYSNNTQQNSSRGGRGQGRGEGQSRGEPSGGGRGNKGRPRY
jgi:ATP-dependent RNA helicase DHX36